MSFPIQLAKALHRTNFLVPTRSPLACESMRSMSKRICAEDNTPRCSKENIGKTPCAIALAKKRTEIPPEPYPYTALFTKPECCYDPCKDFFPRFDDLYYKSTDKSKRIYKQTWNECPDKKIVKKAICNYKNIIYPKLELRARKKRPKTACASAGEKLQISCNKTGSVRCIKITLPGCRAVRDPPKCKKSKDNDCKKICCPYPCFSECLRRRPKKRHPRECNCLRTLSMCDVWAEMRKRVQFKS